MVIVKPFLLLYVAALPCSRNSFDRFCPLADAFEAMILSTDTHNTCSLEKNQMLS